MPRNRSERKPFFVSERRVRHSASQSSSYRLRLTRVSSSLWRLTLFARLQPVASFSKYFDDCLKSTEAYTAFPDGFWYLTDVSSRTGWHQDPEDPLYGA